MWKKNLMNDNVGRTNNIKFNAILFVGSIETQKIFFHVARIWHIVDEQSLKMVSNISLRL